MLREELDETAGAAVRRRRAEGGKRHADGVKPSVEIAEQRFQKVRFGSALAEVGYRDRRGSCCSCGEKAGGAVASNIYLLCSFDISFHACDKTLRLIFCFDKSMMRFMTRKRRILNVSSYWGYRNTGVVIE